MKSERKNPKSPITVHYKADQRQLLEEGAALLVAHIPGARMGLGPFLLYAGLEKAQALIKAKKDNG